MLRLTHNRTTLRWIAGGLLLLLCLSLLRTLPPVVDRVPAPDAVLSMHGSHDSAASAAITHGQMAQSPPSPSCDHCTEATPGCLGDSCDDACSAPLRPAVPQFANGTRAAPSAPPRRCSDAPVMDRFIPPQPA